MRTGMVGVLLVCCLVGAGCGGDDVSPESGSGGTSGTGGTGGAGTGGTQNGGQGGQPVSCDLECPNFDQRCSFRDGQCGRSDPSDMACVPRAQDCIYTRWDWNPACSCFDNAIDYDCGFGDTQPPENCDKLECGTLTCDKANEYCEVTETAYACRPLPETCDAEVSCECVADETCGRDCQGSATWGLRLACKPE